MVTLREIEKRRNIMKQRMVSRYIRPGRASAMGIVALALATSLLAVAPATANAGTRPAKHAHAHARAATRASSSVSTTMGYVEVCKNAADPETATQSFAFSINGGSHFTVHAGQCSQPYQVPAGTATIAEFDKTNFTLVGVSTCGPTDPACTRLISVVTNPTDAVATVTVPAGGVGDETVATFTNEVNTGDFKVCVQQSSADANMWGHLFSYTYSYKVGSATISGSFGVAVASAPNLYAICTNLYGPVPVVNPNGLPVRITITQLPAPKADDIQTNSILYQGNTPPSGVFTTSPLPTQLPSVCAFNVGQGINVCTYTNGRTHV